MEPGDPIEDPAQAGGALPVLLLMVLISIVGFGIVIPLLPFYGKVFGAPAWQITLLFSTYSLGQFLGELTWGRLSDRIGRKPVLLGTNVLSALSYVAFAFAPDIWTAIAIRAASGFFSGNISTIQGYIADVSPRERLVGRMGLVGGALGSGFVLGPSLGGLLARPELGAEGFRLPMLLAAGLFVAAAVGVLLFVRESRRAVSHHRGPSALQALAQALTHVGTRRLLAITFLAMSGFSAMWSILGFWGEAQFGWGPREIGVVMGGVGAGAALGQAVIAAPVARARGEVGALMAGLVIAGAFMIVQTSSPWPWMAAGALFVATIGHTLAQPPTASLMSRFAAPEMQGSVLGANAAGASLARVGGPLVGGVLYTSAGAHAPFIVAALSMFAAAWMAVEVGRHLGDSAG